MSNVYLRNAFDTDPSIYLGRFVPAAATELDEGSAMPLTCSAHVKYRFIEGGGVKFTEHMNVTAELAARIGVPAVASASGSAGRSREVKVEYVLTGKMVAEIPDPIAFEECCKSRPDQCTDRFIGEFLQGTGAVYRQAESHAEISGSGTNPTNGVSGSGAASRTASWTQAIEFPNPVYFAFKITQTPNNRATSSCGAWVDSPPVEAGHVFVVGSSREAKTERAARERALRNAQFKAFMSLGPVAQVGTDGNVTNQAEVQAAQQWAMGVQPLEICVEVVRGGKAPRYLGRVLGKLPAFVRGTVPPSAPVGSTPPTIDPEIFAPEPAEDDTSSAEPGADSFE
jgi:hypothetical protein